MAYVDLEQIVRIVMLLLLALVILNVRHLFSPSQKLGSKFSLAGIIGSAISSLFFLVMTAYGYNYPIIFSLIIGFFYMLIVYGVWKFFHYTIELAINETRLQADTKRLTDILDAGTDGSWEWDLKDDSFWMSPGFLNMIELEHEIKVSMDIKDRVHPDDYLILVDEIKAYFKKQRSSLSVEVRVRREEEYIWLLVRGKALRVNGESQTVSRLLGSVTDISERKAEDKLISSIADSVSAHTGQHFLHSLAQNLQQALKAEGVFIAQISGENLMRTALLSQGNKVLANEAFSYQGTPCEEVLQAGIKLVALGENQAGGQLLQQLSANYMAAVALRSGGNKATGLLAVLFNALPKKETRIYSLLRIFGVRVAAELERSKAESVLRQREASYRSFVNKSTEGIWCLDFDEPISVHLPVDELTQQIFNKGYMAECNLVVAQMYGFKQPEELNGQYLNHLLPGKFLKFLFSGFERFVSNGFHLSAAQEYPIRQENGVRWYTTNMTGITENGLLHRIWGIHRDISDLHHHMQQIEHQASHDALTGLKNRYALMQELDQLLQADKPLSLMIMDLNRFKEINDSLGHQYGDSLLCQIGPRLSLLMDEHEAMLARLGGDEFAILIAQNDEAALEAICSNILLLLQRPFELDGGFSVEIGASIGVAILDEGMPSLSELMRCADVAMYVAKQRSLGFCFYNEDTDKHSPDHLILVTELGKAIREDELVLHFQPKINLRSKVVEGAEVLVRWKHPLRGLISPGRFMPAAETTDLIRPLTHWVLEHSIKQVKQWQDKHGVALKLAINISARNLLDQKLPELLHTLLLNYQLDAGLIELEITESAVMADTQMARDILGAVSDLGVEISIDDFGTGYTSLGYLDYLPIDKLKIDLSFVRNMLNSEHDAKLVRTITNLAHDFGLQVIAEGVETVAIQDALRDLGCDQGQGYYISPPLSSANLLSWLQKKPARNPAQV